MFTRSQQSLLTKIGNWQLTNSSSLLIVIFAFLFSLVGSTALIYQEEQEKLRQKQDSLAVIADEYSLAIQHDIEQTLSLNYALANLVEEYQGFIPNFESVAHDLFPFYQGAGSLALVPSGIAAQKVTGTRVIGEIDDAKINPREICSQSPLKLDNSHLQDVPPYPELSLNTIAISTTGSAKIGVTQTASAKPIGLGCLPIFLAEKTDHHSFWGFTSVLIDYSLLLQDLDWESLAQKGVAYQLEIDAADREGARMVLDSWQFDSLKSDFFRFGFFGAIAVNPVIKSFRIAGETWTLSLLPIDGWQQRDSLKRAYLIGLIGSLLLAALIKVSLDSQLDSQELEETSYLDPLTRLPNHLILQYRLKQILAKHLHEEQNLVLCHLNLDDFGKINQEFGRRVGDYLLVRITKRLQKFLRIEDLVARLEGDEFGIILQNIQNCEEAERILERIMDAVSSPIDIEDSSINLSVSIGATIYPRHNLEANHPYQDNSRQPNYLRQMLLTQARQSLLQTKQQKDSYLFFKDLCQFNPDYCGDAYVLVGESEDQE